MFRIARSRSWPLKIYFTQNLKRWELGRLLDKCPALATGNSRRLPLGRVRIPTKFTHPQRCRD